MFSIFFAPLPKLFWSEYLNNPFNKCIDCEVPLAEANAYVVQKRFVRGEAIFEMAVCERCREKLSREYSEETCTAITNHMSERFRRNAEQLAQETGDLADDAGEELLDRCMNVCLMCDAARESCHRYSLAGLCRDVEIVAQISPLGQTPIMICETCEMDMASLISQKTRDSWDRFIEEHFDGPPGIELDSPSTHPLAF